MSSLPSQHRALVLESVGSDFIIKSLPTTLPTPGSAVVQIHCTGVLSYHREIYNGSRPYPFPLPIVGGFSAIARIVALGPDAVSLNEGQLVYVDCVVRGRDDRSTLFLSAIHNGFSEGSRSLMRDVWRDGTFAEFARVPLENCIALNEPRLCGELGYSLQDLIYLCYLLVPYGGLRDIKLEPGETIVMCPATGGFGGVQVAVAMGARVIAMGRNEEELKRLKQHIKRGTPSATIETVKMTGDVEMDAAALQKFGTIDAALDISPPAAAQSTHLKSVINSLRKGGRASLMGSGGYHINDWKIMGDNITLKGKLMYERDDIVQLVKMLENGLLPRGKDFVDVKPFSLEEWKEAFDTAAEFTGVGRLVVMKP
ncbi:uncharacterized protein EAE97_012162 [Botrytis byssoidea]|uniref:Alcohol dehydrogenase-like C-terminal domain-containing protein n=1 Tax=Botrytis byssoidea TaxID=139641 RepID=A0A9P5LF69_9HELO|nr:uncharacterized protein EAE97_012162 [Botrytis byssoidea]KAF7916071.1 hypothetical protein EAE97_012162 [Botrytis byssoidea]